MTGEALAPEPTEEDLTEEAERLRRRQWVRLVMLVVSLFVFVLGASYYANWKAERTARDNDKRWCSLLGTMDTAYQENPPTTATGRQLAQDIHGLHESFQCPKPKP